MITKKIGWLAAALTALGFSACLDRNYDNPFLTGDGGAGEDWKRDDNGNGIADSVEAYAPNCAGSPSECLTIARDNAAQAGERIAESGQGKTPADTSKAKGNLADTLSGTVAVKLPIPPRDTARPPVDTVKAIPPVDTVKVVQPMDTAKVIPPVDTVKIILPVDTVKVIPPIDIIKVIPPVDTAKAIPPVDTVKVISVQAISATDMVLELGAAGQTPTVSVLPAGATHLGYALTSAQPDIVGVNGSTLKPVKGGKALITIASADGPTSTFTVTVPIHVASVSAPDISLIINDSKKTPKPMPKQTVAVTVLPVDAGNQTYGLTSLDSGIVLVSGNEVTAVAEGVAVIRITSADGGRTGTFTVTVEKKPGKGGD